MQQRVIARVIAAALAVVVGLTGCATQGGAGVANNGSDGECNAAGAALVGALLGAAIGGGNNRVRGAAAGAGLASLACAAYNYNSRQTKTAAQVQQEYRQANQGQLPAQNRVTRYETTMESGGRIKPGTQMQVMSTIEVVQGTQDRPPVLEEELTLRRPDGKDINVRKKAAEKGTGAFNTTYSMKMPEGVQQGEYPVDMTLYMNGQRVANRSMRMQVVAGPEGMVLASLQ